MNALYVLPFIIIEIIQIILLIKKPDIILNLWYRHSLWDRRSQLISSWIAAIVGLVFFIIMFIINLRF